MTFTTYDTRALAKSIKRLVPSVSVYDIVRVVKIFFDVVLKRVIINGDEFNFNTNPNAARKESFTIRVVNARQKNINYTKRMCYIYTSKPTRFNYKRLKRHIKIADRYIKMLDLQAKSGRVYYDTYQKEILYST